MRIVFESGGIVMLFCWCYFSYQFVCWQKYTFSMLVPARKWYLNIERHLRIDSSIVLVSHGLFLIFSCFRESHFCGACLSVVLTITVTNSSNVALKFCMVSRGSSVKWLFKIFLSQILTYPYSILRLINNCGCCGSYPVACGINQMWLMINATRWDNLRQNNSHTNSSNVALKFCMVSGGCSVK